MSQIESASAEQLVGYGMKAAEGAARLAGSVAKNLAALLLAWSKSGRQEKGRTALTRLLSGGREAAVFELDAAKQTAFTAEAKRYGVPFTIIRNKTAPYAPVDIVVRADDAARVNRVIEAAALIAVSKAPLQQAPLC